MTDTLAANEAGSAPANETVAPEVTTLAANETPANTAEPGPAPLGDKGLEELKTQRKKRQAAEQEAAYWRGVAEAGGKKPEETQVRQPEGPPVLDKFESYDDYLIAKAKYEFNQEQKQKQTEEDARKIKDTYNERYRKAVEKHPDLPQISRTFIQNPSIPQNPAMAQAIMESEVGPEIVYHLGQNPQDAIRIASLSPTAAAREIGKIEAKLLTTPKAEPQKISQAPEPIKAVGNKGTVSVMEYDKGTMEDFMKRRNSESPPPRR